MGVVVRLGLMGTLGVAIRALVEVPAGFAGRSLEVSSGSRLRDLSLGLCYFVESEETAGSARRLMQRGAALGYAAIEFALPLFVWP